MKKETKVREISKFDEVRGLVDALETVIENVNNERKWQCKSYQKIGYEDEQAKDRDGNLLWEDEEQTIPKYREKWDYVDVDIETMSDKDYAKYLAFNKILETLNNMI